ncbi:MAG: alkaline phosphatase family protein [Planctomycetota bacterium]
MNKFKTAVLLVFVLALAAGCGRPAAPESPGASPRTDSSAAVRGIPPEIKARADYAVIVSLDGLRPDAIPKAEAPVLQGLIRQGAFAKARGTMPTDTLPSHVSLVTGLEARRHGVDWNDSRGGNVEFPTVFSTVKQAGRTTALFFAKGKLRYLARPGDVDFTYGPEPDGFSRRDVSAAGIAAAFASEWPRRKFALTVVHFAEMDAAGHSTGWMSSDYIRELNFVDQAVGILVKTIGDAALSDKTVFIVTADHGGMDHTHGGDSPEEITIPWICVGPNVSPGLSVKNPVRLVDTAPTALAFLGLVFPKGIDGKAVGEVLP